MIAKRKRIGYNTLYVIFEIRKSTTKERRIVIMHKFMKAIGFKNMNKEELNQIIQMAIEKSSIVNVATDSQNNEFVEMKWDVGDSIGICVCGTYDENGDFCMDYYYPYFYGAGITSEENVEVETHADKESYAVICDDIKVGVTLIYYLQNTAEYLKEFKKWKHSLKNIHVSSVLSGLSLEGKVILPMSKKDRQSQNNQKLLQDRNHLIAAARAGDEDAIESLTLEDIDTYSMLSKRVQYEDILTIVDTYFMPYGIESDQYSILGEILNFFYTTNEVTGEKICIMTLNTNDLVYDVCIQEKDLLGEPEVGRRFKGIIWMQGTLQYMN